MARYHDRVDDHPQSAGLLSYSAMLDASRELHKPLKREPRIECRCEMLTFAEYDVLVKKEDLAKAENELRLLKETKQIEKTSDITSPTLDRETYWHIAEAVHQYTGGKRPNQHPAYMWVRNNLKPLLKETK